MDEPKVITDATIAGATSIDSTRSPLPKNRLKAWSALLMAHARLTDSVDRDLQAAGLPSLSWYDVLFAIYNAPGRRMRQSDLAETVLLSRSGLTRLVDRLETEGMLVREHCAQDLRGVHAVLTGEGLRCLRRIWIVYRGSIQDRFGKHMTSAEADELVAILSRWQIGESKMYVWVCPSEPTDIYQYSKPEPPVGAEFAQNFAPRLVCSTLGVNFF